MQRGFLLGTPNRKALAALHRHAVDHIDGTPVPPLDTIEGPTPATGPRTSSALGGDKASDWIRAFMLAGNRPASSVRSPLRPWSARDTDWMWDIIYPAHLMHDFRATGSIPALLETFSRRNADPTTSSGFAVRAPDSDILNSTRLERWESAPLRAGFCLTSWSTLVGICRDDQDFQPRALLNGCCWCGHPTGNCCDDCEQGQVGPNQRSSMLEDASWSLCAKCKGVGCYKCRRCAGAGPETHPYTVLGQP
jgi:hypothetical protein